jgi:ubiquinone/menaquinone biosynthesis C-methylase UbiE
MVHSKPFSQACANNRQPILECIKTVFTEPATILEIGTGTGQHAVYFAAEQQAAIAENAARKILLDKRLYTFVLLAHRERLAEPLLSRC